MSTKTRNQVVYVYGLCMCGGLWSLGMMAMHFVFNPSARQDPWAEVVVAPFVGAFVGYFVGLSLWDRVQRQQADR